MKGKTKITVRFQSTGGNELAAIYGIRIVRTDARVEPGLDPHDGGIPFSAGGDAMARPVSDAVRVCDPPSERLAF